MTTLDAMLPTPPASLPTSSSSPDITVAAQGGGDGSYRDMAESSAESDVEEGVDLRRRGGNGGEGRDGGVSDGMVDDARPSARLPTPPSGPFSTSAPITRPFRSRYASSSTDSLPPVDSEASPPAAQKRRHSNVSPSTGFTPPASYDFDTDIGMFSPPSLSLDLALPRDQPREGDSWMRRAEEGSAGPTRRPSLAMRWRSSFSRDADRAEPTTSTSVVSATAPATSAQGGRLSSMSLLRRRTTPFEAPPTLAPLAPTPLIQLDRERGGSKRRRSSTLLSDDSAEIGRSSRTASGLDNYSTSSSFSSRAPVEPVLSRSNSTNIDSSNHGDFRTIGRRARLSLNWLGNSASREQQQPPFPALQNTGPPFPPTAPRDISPLTRAPTSTRPFASPSIYLDSTSASPLDLIEHSDRLTLHARRSSDLSSSGEGLLREAAGVLRRAEETFGRASREVQRTEASRERDRERRVAERLPSVGGLPTPEEASGGRPVVGVRLGEGWLPRPFHATSPTFETLQSPPAAHPPPGRRRRFSFPSPLTSPNPSNQEPQSPDGASTSSSSASNRARQFITQLRARRPRLSRNSPAVTPPEDGPAGDSRLSLARTESSTTTLRSWTLPSPPLVTGLVGSSFDEDFEAAEAARLNRHLLERRRLMHDLDLRPPAPLASPPRDSPPQTQATPLWGEPGSPQSSSNRGFRRFRGPTERANERWRRGEQPLWTSSTTTATSSATGPFLSPWRRHSATAPATPAVTAVRPSPPTLDDGISSGTADAFIRRREESPSPRSWRLRNDMDGMMSTRALNAAEEGAAPNSTFSSQFARPLRRPAFRLPQPDSSRPSSRPRVLFDEPDEASPSDWPAAPMGPFMLPSGSDGRRMVFPNPANPAGPSEHLATSNARGEPLASDLMGRQRSGASLSRFGPDHLFEQTPPYDGESPRLSTWSRASMPWDEPAPRRTPGSRFNPFGDFAPPSTTSSTAQAAGSPADRYANSRIPSRRSSLADALAHFGTRTSSDGTSRTTVTGAAVLRRRNAGTGTLANAVDAAVTNAEPEAETVEDRLAQHRQSRFERLQALRRERNAMRTLLGGAPSPDPAQQTGWSEPASEPVNPPRSPGWRRAGLANFLRGLGGRSFVSIFDDDFASFWGRDSAALDSRNYVDDDEFDTSYEALIRLSERLGDAKPRGMSSEKVAALRKFKYTEWPMHERSSTSAPLPVASTSASKMDEDLSAFARRGLEKEERCAICLDDYVDDDDCMLGHCGHGFHEDCLTMALKEKGTCPVCRYDHTIDLPTSHTFSPLPGFFERPHEIRAVERSLGAVPAFTVLFGASSVGKTALLRQVLSSDRFHVLHFDLRIAGFADLASLHSSLSAQLESYFEAIPELMGGKKWGWHEFAKEALAFKYEKQEVAKRVENGGEVKTSDIAHLLELFQSALLSYWNFKPELPGEPKDNEEKDSKERKAAGARIPGAPDSTAQAFRRGGVPEPKGKSAGDDLMSARSVPEEDQKRAEAVEEDEATEKKDEEQPPPRRIPVFFLDEAHKLPALISSTDAMKAFLDAVLVLTKQDRLCHVLHATSDSFYLHWLRQLNVMQHACILSVGDAAKDEARRYFNEALLPHIPDKLKSKISFDAVYTVFGGKLAHLSDYVNEFVNSDGVVTPLRSSHFLQAHSLLNLHLIHSAPTSPGDEDSPSQGFQIYSSLRSASPHASPSPFGNADSGSDFLSSDLLHVMQRLQPGQERALPYFPLCRKLGAKAVDGMVRGRILELRWNATITEEGDPLTAEEREKLRGSYPLVVPTTPVVRRAMAAVLQEYEREGYKLPEGV
ncbi:zinc finger, RING-type protein [Rhodotorula toruloides]|uniref:Zinc finger, RING-type protein n=1 Tax=Rhodotorula toruloides TaxID=5286 RepID=A0A511KLM8_RHOTO|nr:zinc finger, RING-type protein [Rhodotorula toruloides]